MGLSFLEARDQLRSFAATPMKYSRVPRVVTLPSSRASSGSVQGVLHQTLLKNKSCKSTFKNRTAQANDLESLEIQLKTCEIYRCTKCGNVAINLQNIKSHIQQDHEGENKNRVVHTKISRESTEEVTSKTYRLEEL